MKAESADLRDIFKEIGTKAGIEVEIHPEVRGTITSDFTDRNLQVAMVELAKGFSYGFVYDKAGKKWILRKVTIIPSGKPEVVPTPPDVAARVTEIIEQVKNRDYDALPELRVLAPQALPVLGEALMATDPRERMSGFLRGCLRDLMDERAIPYLRQYLQKFDEAIESPNHPEKYPPKALKSERRNFEDEIHTLEAFIFINTLIPKDMPPQGRIPIYAGLLEHENGNSKIIHVATIKLGELYRSGPSPTQVLDVFIERLKAPESYVRSFGAGQLGYLGDPYALPALREALNDPVEGVREDAQEAIENILSKHLNDLGGRRCGPAPGAGADTGDSIVKPR